MERKFVHNFCNIRGDGVFGQNWFCSIFSYLSLSLPRLGKFIVFFLCFFFFLLFCFWLLLELDEEELPLEEMEVELFLFRCFLQFILGIF